MTVFGAKIDRTPVMIYDMLNRFHKLYATKLYMIY